MLKPLTKTFFVAVLLVCHIVAHAEDRHWIRLGPEDNDVTTLAIDPSTPQIIYAGTLSYGLFRSTDGGTSWNRIGSNIGISGGYAIAIDPSSPETVYINGGGGVNKSTDGGTTWNYFEFGLSPEEGPGNVAALAIDPVDSQIVYAANSDRLFRSTNGGVSWNRVLTVYGQIKSLAIDPASTQTIYAGGSSSVFRSQDGGDNWSELKSGLPLANIASSLAVDPHTGTVYMSTEIGIYKFTKASPTWTQAGLNDSWIENVVLDPSMPSMIYAAGARGVFKSTNAGGSWVKIMDAECGAFGLAVSSAAPQILYTIEAGFGVQKSMDWGNTWSARNTGLPASSTRTVTVHPQDGQILYAGGVTGLYKSTNKGSEWQLQDFFLEPKVLRIDPISPDNMFISTGLGVYGSTDSGANWGLLEQLMADILVVDPQMPETIYANGNVFSFGTNLFKSTDAGITWSPASTGLPYNISALSIDPINSQTLYAAIDLSPGVYKSTDGANSWNLINTDLPAAKTLVVDPIDTQTIYAGTVWNGVYKSTDAGIHWNATNNGLPSTGVPILAINPSAPETLYIVLDDIGSSVYESRDGGDSWRSISDGLSASSIMDLAIDPTPPHVLYVSAFEGGVWAYTPEPLKMILETVDPSVATAGSAAFTITISGRNFPADSTVLWDGFALATEYVNSFQLNATIPANLISTSGVANITVSAESQASAIFGFAIQPNLVSATITTNPAGRSFTVDGVAYSSSQTFDWEQGSSHTISVISPQAGSGGTRHVFANWSDGGAMSHTIAVPATATTYTANFTTQYQLTTSVSPSGGGSIIATPTSSDGYYNAGSSVQLTATPNTGYSFSAWSGSLTGNTNPKTFTLSAPGSVSATFLSSGGRTRPSRLSTPYTSRARIKRVEISPRE